MKIWIVLLLSFVMVSAGGISFAGGGRDKTAMGEALYNKNCSRCHGVNGLGTDKGPPFINKIYRPSHHSDMSFQMAILNGVRAHHWNFGDMPSLEGVSMSDAGMIIKYVRGIQRDNGIY